MNDHASARHPRGSRARVLLTSVFGPYAQDDAYGSRAINPMELYHNQVTRCQGAFSLRMFHRSWGLMLIQANLDAPCTLLDFPSLERFVDELVHVPYDVVGISAILPNVGKVKAMCALVRRHRPEAQIVVGGHVANKPGLRELVGADHVVPGEGVRWFRSFLGEPVERPIRHPAVVSAFDSRTMGVPFGGRKGETAATVIPSVGCPLGCNFCSTSAMFGGKGRSYDFYRGGDELFRVFTGLEQALAVRSFFVMDENFLLHRKRALRLLELMREHGRAWSLYVFSSANTLRLYSDEELLGLGLSWVWIGLEGKRSAYAKLAGADTRALVRRLQGLGIRVLGSSIVGLPEHTPDNLDAAIEHAVAHDTEFHQFMLYTPISGTPLHAEHREAGTLLGEDECPDADAHGQLRFNFRHPHLPSGAETAYLLRAFHRDFEVNGPSLARIARTMLEGWLAHKDHPDPRVRDRFAWECKSLPTLYAGALWAAEHWLRRSPAAARIGATRRRLTSAFGLRARLAGPLLGTLLLATLWREERRLRRGVAHEPRTFYEANPAALSEAAARGAVACRWVEPAGAASLPADAAAGTAPPAPDAVRGASQPVAEAEGQAPVVLSTGALSRAQLEALFSALPVDVTFVDASNRVRFISQGRRPVFARPRAILGGLVQQCHSPASVHVVEGLLDDFRAGRQDVAEFWLDHDGRFVHTRYRALRDEAGAYLGTLEVTQDLTRERALEGERRVLSSEG